MNLPMGLLITLVVFVFIFILAALVFSFRSSDNQDYLDQISLNEANIALPDSWTLSQPSDNPNRNSCQLYTFPAIEFSNETVLPATPNLDSSSLNSLPPGSLNAQSCFDVDQVIAKEMVHQCRDTGSNLPSLCYRQDGTLANPGQSETYYQTCPNNSCPGFLGVMALDFEPGGPARCVRSPAAVGDPYGVTLSGNCNLADPNQLFRFVVSPQDSSSNTSQKLWVPMALIDRRAQVSLVPDTDDPGPDDLVIGTDASESPSYVWLFMPPFSYQADLAPPQIIYVGNVDMSTFPLSSLNLNENQDLAAWLTSNLILSLTINPDGFLTFDYYEFGQQPNPNTTNPYNILYDYDQSANLIPYTLYNTVYNREICVYNNGRSTGVITNPDLRSQIGCISI